MFTMVLVSGPLGQVAAIVIGDMALCRAHTGADVHDLPLPVSARAGHLAGLAFSCSGIWKLLAWAVVIVKGVA